MVADGLCVTGRPVTHFLLGPGDSSGDGSIERAGGRASERADTLARMTVAIVLDSAARIGPDLRGFFEYNSILMEPWDGPAAMSFSDGRLVGALLDRNGLRPARYTITKDGFMVLASEAGVLDIDPAIVAQKGALSPGKMIVVDTQAGRVIHNDEINKLEDEVSFLKEENDKYKERIEDLESLIYPTRDF